MSSAFQKKGLSVVALVAALVAVAWWSQREPETAAAPPPTAAPSLTAAPVVAAARPAEASACRFEAGQRLAYTVALESESSQVVLSSGQPLSASLALTARLELEALSPSPEGPVLLARLDEVKASGGQGLEAGLGAPFLLQLDEACRLTRYARHQQTARPVARNQQALLFETQFSARPAEAFTFETGNGRALAVLERVEPGVLRRTLARYEALWSEPSAEGSVAEGALRVQLGAGPWFEALSSTETLHTTAARAHSLLTLTRLEPVQGFADTDRERARYAWENLLPRATRVDLVSRPFTTYDAARQQKVKDLTVTEAVDQFAARVTQRQGVQDTWPELSAYFEVHPEAVRPAVKRYRDHGLPKEAAGDFFLALGKARTPEAKAVLLELKRDEAVPMDSVRAMFALVVREDVGVELAQELAGDITRNVAKRTPSADFHAGEAMLALSTLSGTRENPAVAATTRQALESVLSMGQRGGAVTEPARVALKAVGNTGDATLLPLVEPWSRLEDIETRKAAAWAFSRMPPENSEAAELAWLQRETSPFVKRALYLSIQQQHFNLGQGASRALVQQAAVDLKTEKSALTRQSMVRLIAQSAVAKEPEVRELLKAQAKAERAARSPLLNEFASILTPDEIAEVLR